jgi:hypothetical protein
VFVGLLYTLWPIRLEKYYILLLPIRLENGNLKEKCIVLGAHNVEMSSYQAIT